MNYARETLKFIGRSIFHNLPQQMREDIMQGALRNSFHHRRETLTRRILEDTNGFVQSGPFRGMKIKADASWGDLGTKLLGIYESELSPTIEMLIKDNPD